MVTIQNLLKGNLLQTWNLAQRLNSQNLNKGYNYHSWSAIIPWMVSHHPKDSPSPSKRSNPKYWFGILRKSQVQAEHLSSASACYVSYLLFFIIIDISGSFAFRFLKDLFTFKGFCLIIPLRLAFEENNSAFRVCLGVLGNKLGVYWAKLSSNWNWNFILLHSRFIT